MIPGVECKSCAFWEFQPGIIRPDRRRIGQCRRGAPVVTQSADGRCHASFPLIAEGEWCGDHATVDLQTGGEGE